MEGFIKNIIISGITGQDAGYLTKLIPNDYKIIGLLREKPKHRKSQYFFRLEELETINRIEFVKLALHKKDDVESLIKKYKPIYFYHLGSQSSVERSFYDKDLTLTSNFQSTKNILDSISKYSKDTIFFFPSSCNIYEGYKNQLVDEQTTPKPLSSYAKSKFAVSEYIENSLEQNELNINTGILFSHESEFRRKNFFSKFIIEHLIDFKFNNKEAIKVGNLDIKRDIGYAKEYVEAIYKINTYNLKESFIVSSNELYTLNLFVETAMLELNIDFKKVELNNEIIYIDKKNNKPIIKSSKKLYREIELEGIRGDNYKIMNSLGWKPELKLKDIVNRMLHYEINKNK